MMLIIFPSAFMCQVFCCMCVFFCLLAYFLPGAWLPKVWSMYQWYQHHPEALRNADAPSRLPEPESAFHQDPQEICCILKFKKLELPWWSSGWDPAKAENTGLIPGMGRFHMLRQLSPCTTTAEAQGPRAHAPQPEKPPQWKACAPHLEGSPCSLQLAKPMCCNEDPAQTKINE